LAFPVGLDREEQARSAGIRTFCLVSVGTCGFVLMFQAMNPSVDSNSRLLQGLMTGIGFIGSGAILKGPSHVHGTATAAAIWSVAAVGASTAYGQYDIAIILTLVTFLSLRFMGPIKMFEQERSKAVEGRERRDSRD
jgi:putative Mg2+ transporter-C (MgtC) family protein